MSHHRPDDPASLKNPSSTEREARIDDSQHRDTNSQSGYPNADSGTPPTLLSQGAPPPSAEWVRKLRNEAMLAAARSRGELSSSPLKTTLSSGRQPEDFLAAWSQDESLSFSRRERQALRRKTTMQFALAMMVFSGILAWAVQELHPALHSYPGVAELHEGCRKTLAYLPTLIHRPSMHQAPGAMVAGLSTASSGKLLQSAAPDHDLEKAALIQVGWTPLVSTTVPTPPLFIPGISPNGLPGVNPGLGLTQPAAPRIKKVVTSARSAKALAAQLAPWATEASSFPALDASGLILVRISPRNSQWQFPDQSYIAPTPLAVKALREALQAQYPDGFDLPD